MTFSVTDCGLRLAELIDKSSGKEKAVVGQVICLSNPKQVKRKGLQRQPRVTRESSGSHFNVQNAVHLPGGEPA